MLKNLSGADGLFNDGIGLGGPFEGCGLGVPCGDPGVDGGFELRNALEGAAPDLLAGDFGEQPLHEIKPGRGGGRVVHLETRMCIS